MATFTDSSTVEQLRTEVLECQHRLSRLTAHSLNLTAKIDDAAHDAKVGKIAGGQLLGTLTVDKAETDHLLDVAKRELSWAEKRLADAQEAHRKAALDRIEQELISQRAQVIAHCRQAALSLGRIAQLDKEVTSLLNAAKTPSGGPWPHETAVFRPLLQLPQYETAPWISDKKYLPVALDSFTIRIKPLVKLAKQVN